MSPGATRLLRDNVFLVAAVCLPILVVGFFLLSSSIPRWRVPAPAYDLLIRAGEYDQTTQRVSLDLDVRDGVVQATARPVAALAGRRVITTPNAPDGYELRAPLDRGGAGIVGELFGMRRHSPRVAIVNGGRVVPLEIPTPYEYYSPIYFVGWVLDEGQR